MAASDAVYSTAIARREVRNSLNRLDYHLGRGPRGVRGVNREIRFLDALHRQSVRVSGASVGRAYTASPIVSFGNKAAAALSSGSSSQVGRMKSSLLADFSVDSLKPVRDSMLNQDWVWVANGSACPTCLLEHGSEHPSYETFSPMHPSCLCIPMPADLGIRRLSDAELVSTVEQYGLERYQGQVQAFKEGRISRETLRRREAVNRTHAGREAVEAHAAKAEVRQTALVSPSELPPPPSSVVPNLSDSPDFNERAINEYNWARKVDDATKRQAYDDGVGIVSGPWDEAEIARMKIGEVLERVGATLDDVKSAWDDVLARSETRIDFSRDNLDSILRDGRFKTIHETGTSGGSVSPRYRADLERRLWGVAEDAPPSARPVYGYAGEAGGGPSTFYGDVSAVLKSEVKDRSTWTMGDSLAADNIVPGASAQFPWKKGLFDPVTGVNWEGFAFNTADDVGRNASMILEASLSRPMGPGKYVETQIWGGVGLDDIEKLVFAKRGPTSEVARRLRELNIPWEVVK